jgi:predicted GIY-YIG superfamily endonuclease
MSNIATLTVAGASGRQYKFNVYPIDTKFAPVAAVYLVTKRTPNARGGGSHSYLYVGQTGNLPERFDNHHKEYCFRRNGANCVCVHQDGNEQSRLSKERDIYLKHRPPCND